VTVVETDDQTDQASTTVTVEEPLTAAFDRSPLEPETGEEVTFVASDSTGDITEYRWDFDGDSTVDVTRTDAFVTHTYTEAGQQTVTLTVADGTGETAQTNKSLTVGRPAQFAVTIASTTAPVTEGQQLSVTIQVENTGDARGTQTVELDAGSLGTDATSISLDSTASTTVTLNVSTAVGDYGTQTLAVSSANDTATSDASVSMQPLAEGPPTDLDGDGLYEDVRGDGNLSLLDVQALFEHRHSDIVRTNSAAFNFQEFDSEVNILDVQVLFNLLSS
jgi:PKD repeat protein